MPADNLTKPTWDGEDIRKVRHMARRTKGDGTPRFTAQDIAAYTGMPLPLVERTIRADDRASREYRFRDPDTLWVKSNDAKDLTSEGRRFATAARLASDALARRIAEVYG